MTRLTVRYESGAGSVTVGELLSSSRRIYFQYDAEFRARGLELSPFHLPTSIVEPVEERARTFAGLHGLFSDSLPDGWGLILMERALRARGVDAALLSPVDRLAYIGARGMGALTYHPSTERDDDVRVDIDLAEVADQSHRILEGSAETLLPELLRAGGSPMGARPKIVVGVRRDYRKLTTGTSDLPAGYRHWLIKFFAAEDPADTGAVEMAYAHMARTAGITMPKTYLFSARGGKAYFGVQRFDRDPANSSHRIHVHTLAGLLHADHRVPGQDYDDFLKATLLLTKQHDDVEEAFRRMVFNIFANNRDDHTKNFAFQMAEDGEWRLAPAYDLMFSTGMQGQHTMTIAGEGETPTWSHVARVAAKASIAPARARHIVDQVDRAVSRWPRYAEQYGVLRKSTKDIQKRLAAVRAAFGSTAGELRPRRVAGAALGRQKT